VNIDDVVELELLDAGAVGQARLAAQDLARRLGARGEAVDRLVLVVSELATSLLVHGGGALKMQPRPGRTVVVTASTRAPGEIDGSAMSGQSNQAGQSSQPGQTGRRAGLGENLALVRRFAASVAIEPGQRISAVVGLG